MTKWTPDLTPVVPFHPQLRGEIDSLRSEVAKVIEARALKPDAIRQHGHCAEPAAIARALKYMMSKWGWPYHVARGKLVGGLMFAMTIGLKGDRGKFDEDGAFKPGKPKWDPTLHENWVRNDAMRRGRLVGRAVTVIQHAGKERALDGHSDGSYDRLRRANDHGKRKPSCICCQVILDHFRIQEVGGNR